MLAQVPPSPLNSNPFPRLGHSLTSQQRQLHSVRPPETSMRRKSREKKNIFLGLEVAETIQWQSWEPGKVITKHLTLKNLQLKPHKLKYSSPSTTFFRTLFPQPIILSPGTSFALPVTFHPLEKREYEDCIRFETSEGTFSVLLRGTLPHHALLIPKSLHLPMCAVEGSSESSFVMRNMSELQMLFKWEVPEPFSMIPVSDVLEPRGQSKVNVIFQPQAALVYDIVAKCWFGDQEEHEKSIQLTAIAKYPHLLVRVFGEEENQPGQKELELCFGPTAIGCIVEKYIEVHNVSPVNAPFHIEREKPTPSLRHVFSCNMMQAVIPPHASLKIPFSFRPQDVGVESVDYFSVIPIGNITKTVLKVTGWCQGPSVSLRSPIVNFGLIKLGEQALRTLEIHNKSSVPAHYRFDIDAKESVFSFDTHCSVLPGNTTQTLKVTFCPTRTIAHYRRVACLIHHQEPLYLDLIGTCHSEEGNPAVLLSKHLSQYRKNMGRGLTFYPPDILGAMLKEGKLRLESDGSLLLPPPAVCGQDPTNSPPVDYPHIDPMTEFFEDGMSSDLAPFPPHVTANINDFNFGHGSVGMEGEPLPLSLTNHTKGTITVFWTCSAESSFRVSPESIEIPPLKSTAFRVLFIPSQVNTLYSAELEAFASYKVVRNYRYVEDATLCPPWCLTIRARGHTFPLGHQHFIPDCVLDSPKVLFPAVSHGSLSHRSLLLHNTGKSPLTFSVDQSSCPSALVKPSCGYISPGAHSILLLRTKPEATVPQKHCLCMELNSSKNYIQEIVLVARAETPLLQLEGDGLLYFKPTCVGTASERSYSLRNTTRLPLRYEWKIKHADSVFLSVSPASGVILPNETASQTWRFVPREEIQYFAKASVFTWGAEEEAEPEKKPRYFLKLFGEGSTGTISAEQEQLDLGNILVGGFQSQDLVLLNNADCGLTYVLSVEQVINGLCDPDEYLNDPIALELEQNTGMIPARTKVVLKMTARPPRRAQYSWTISYAILTPEALDLASTISQKELLCQATAQGIFPSFCISDALPECSSNCITRMQLWRLFSLETLNAYLERDPTPAELIYRVPTRHSTAQRPSIFTPVMLDFNFGAAPVGSDPFVALLMFENKGTVPVNWAFLYPADQQIELEYWAETGEFDPSELHQMRIQDNKLFSVTPKAGTLTPGQQQAVQLMYRHEFVGTDRLPVLLKVSYGREVLLNFIGVTVEKERRYVHFTSTKHQLTPVAIGTASPPKQVYELFNGGSVPVIYEIQLDSLRDVQEDNYQHPIFQCLNPRGEILPGMTAQVEWIFSPLEAKTYTVDIPVHILGGDSALITFQGIGYDQHILGNTGQFEDFSTTGIWTPATQRLTLPGQVALLSMQRVSFGDIPVFSKSSRLIFLINTSEIEAIVYSWYAGSRTVSEALQVNPQAGVLQPGESTLCVITLIDHGQPSFYNMDLVCEVFVQRELAEYEKELLYWEEEKELQAVEFTITEEDLIAEKNSKPPSRSIVDSAGTKKSIDAAPVIRKYKTLPPIKHGMAHRPPASHSADKERMERAARRLWARPEPPNPFQLHLGVTARSHHIEDYFTHFGMDLSKHYIYRKPRDKEKEEPGPPVGLQPETGETEKDPFKPSKQEVSITTDIMAMVIRNLLDDTNFQDMIIQSQDEPLPYFSQLSSKVPSGTRGSHVNLHSRVSIGETPTPQEEEDKREGILEEWLDLEEYQAEETSSQNTMEGSRTPEPVKSGSTHEKPIQETLASEPAEEGKIKRLPAFSILLESILENTLQNIITEANRGEVVLTARPRVIALPPVIHR
ncbi:cilia- and flagella-associated protein 65 [Ambystoma mexicanum]|uniref:cilia- and flagella-associated protein 65 n=1 Tax=Ambystoma mexicanum TaxID=8296 RepID=UPI0037E89857